MSIPVYHFKNDYINSSKKTQNAFDIHYTINLNLLQ